MSAEISRDLKIDGAETQNLKLETRPPIPGSETNQPDVFSEKARPGVIMGHESSLKPAPSPWEGVPVKSPIKKQLKTMAPSPQAGSEAGSVASGRERGFEPEGSADVTPPFSESNSANSTPAYMKWAENLHNLLSDPDGVELYKNYLKTENVGELLDFWFACEGLKRLPSDQNEKIFQLIKVINRKFLRSKMVPIAEETRKVIQDKIGGKSLIDQHIFDSAQIEVEDRMTRTTYRNFLGSEMYLNYIQAMQTGESDFSAKCSGSHSTESSISGRGPPGDDSGHFSALPDIEKSKSSQSLASTRAGLSSALSNPSSSAHPGGDQTSDSTSGISDTSSLAHPPPPSAPNTSANQSNLEDEAPVFQSQMVHSTTLPTLHENSELDLDESDTAVPSLPASLLTSLTSHSLSFTAKKRHYVKPEAQAGVYLQGARVPHPYHAYNSAYNPVSRQDSELQSLSSDAQTTDDNMSSFTENSSHYSNPYRNITNKKHLRRQARKMQEQSRHNRETQPGQHSQNTFIPRTARMPAEASNQLPPAEFAAILTQKLEKLKREQELNEKLTKKLSEDSGSMVSQGSNRSLADILREKLIVPDDMDGDQSILDEHVSRIWTDKTPLRSPGDPSGRPRSPGYSRRGPSIGGPPPGPGRMPNLATPMGTLTTLTAHRTLPGMQPRRQLPSHPHQLPAGGPRRVPPQHPHQVYHQDLAYYEIDPRQQVVPPERTNDRVMEWMLDVERQSTQPTGDQKSQSSKAGAAKTSPRSNRVKQNIHGHRSVSQERMSTSWAGHHSQPPHQQPNLQYQTQLEAEAKRRLGASLAMPPPSQNNTLRKPPTSKQAPTEFTVAVYTFSHEKGEPMPYRIKIPSKNVSLRHVKEFLPKKGAFRFYFKTEIDGDMCYEEETEDTNMVPLWEGKILVQCRLVD
eukprot:GFUD01013851.1.p1 GENE.GFUD01013851.1~~GFUD01013851.1.p1  ORF type:complete len:913 (+),score=250.55 GFUD01013851.1:418-3156(+)